MRGRMRRRSVLQQQRYGREVTPGPRWFLKSVALLLFCSTLFVVLIAKGAGIWGLILPLVAWSVGLEMVVRQFRAKDDE